MTKTVTYTVRGRWPFPLDMLRRDFSKPATPADKELINLASKDTPSHDHPLSRVYEINLISTMSDPRFAPNIQRWESFRWKVTAVNGKTFAEGPPTTPLPEDLDLMKLAVINAAVGLVEAQESFYRFERDNPGNSTSRWDSVFEAKNDAYDRLKAAVERYSK